MKIIFTILLFISFNSYANTECTEAIDNAKLFCESSNNQCGDLHECLVRKDTCVEKEPSNEIECNSLQNCSQRFKVKFDQKFKTNGTKCEYKWHISTSGQSLCMVKGHFLFSEEACPGRISGLMNAIAYGLNTAVDKFDCKAVNKKYKDMNDSCKKSLKKVASICPDTPEYLNKYKNSKCSYSSKFSNFQRGQFSLDQARGNNINQGPRNAPDYRPPHSDDGGGSAGGGSGTVQ